MKSYHDQNAFPPSHLEKWLYDYVVYDSTTIERPYAQQLDRADDVLFCTKLPDSFTIDTPFGSYNPDWAYVEEKDGKQKDYSVIETKKRQEQFSRAPTRGTLQNRLRTSPLQSTFLRLS